MAHFGYGRISDALSRVVIHEADKSWERMLQQYLPVPFRSEVVPTVGGRVLFASWEGGHRRSVDEGRWAEGALSEHDLGLCAICCFVCFSGVRFFHPTLLMIALIRSETLLTWSWTWNFWGVSVPTGTPWTGFCKEKSVHLLCQRFALLARSTCSWSTGPGCVRVWRPAVWHSTR